MLQALNLNRIDVNLEHYDSVLPVWNKQTVGQTFSSKADNLSIVKVFTFRSPYGVLGKAKFVNAEQIIFHLRREDSQQDLRTINFSGANVFDGDWLRLQFVPIGDSAGKNYYFFLESSKSTQENAINLAASTTNIYENGSTILSEKSLGGDLRFQTLYSQPIAAVTSNITKDFTHKLQLDLAFAIFWILILVAILTFVLAKLRKP